MRHALLILAALFLVVTASPASEEQARQAAEDYLDAWLFKDYEEMYYLLIKEERGKLSEDQFADKIGKTTFVPITAEIASVRLNEDTAKVRVTLKDAHDLIRKETLRLSDEEGEWKVAPLYLDVPALARSVVSPPPEAPTPAEARAPDIPQLNLEEILERLVKRGAEVADLVARIKYESPVMGMSVSMSGDMMYKRPNKFRLDFVSPAEVSMISNGRTLWIAAPAAKLGYAADVSDLQEQETVILGLGDSAKKMPEEYDITYMGREFVNERPTYRLKLHSKKESSAMTTAELWIDSELWIPIKTVGESKDGLKVAFTIQSDTVLINTGLEDGLFEYEAQSGMDMLPLDMGLFGE